MRKTVKRTRVSAKRREEIATSRAIEAYNRGFSEGQNSGAALERKQLLTADDIAARKARIALCNGYAQVLLAVAECTKVFVGEGAASLR